MEETHWDDIEQLFEEARVLPVEERTAFLADSCQDDAVRDEILSLLEAYDEATGFFEIMADSLVVPAWEGLKQSRSETDPLRLEGEQVGRYSIEEHLGGGGMGVVYRARDAVLDRTVALKFLSPHLAATEEAEVRFEREAKATSSLDHSNIATIFEIGTAEAGPAGMQRRFIAMGYYDGETLKAKIERGLLPVDEVLDYAVQITEGLRVAHAAGIVHRDVKPANVIVTGQGVVKLVDFGLAKAAEHSVITNPGRRMGTAAYMSPEQALGKDVDARADLWSLGVLLYEMLAGKKPFHRGRDTATVYAILHEDPDPVTTIRPELPARLDQIVRQCLRKELERRYPNASALLRDLEAVRHGEAPPMASSASEDADRSGQSIAILPFETLGTEEATAFTKGIHGDVLTRLSNVGDLHVISRTSVRKYQNADKTIPEIGQELDAAWLVEGEVQEIGDQVRVSARLIDARRDRQVWADDYRRTLTAESLFEIQGEITKKIARELQARVAPEEKQRVEHKPTRNLAAYRLYAQGRRQLDERTEEAMRQAAKYFQEAIDHDPDYALAWVGLADALTLLHDYNYEEPDRVLPRAEQAVRRALELDAELAEAYASLGALYSTRHEGSAAIRALQRAVELQPSYAEAYNWLSWNYQLLGEAEKALESAKRAVELDPLSPEAVSNLSVSLLEVGDVEEALVEARRACEIQPTWATPRFYLALALFHARRFEEALSVLEGLRAPWAGVGPQATLALARLAYGDEDGAQQLLTTFEDNENSFAAGLVRAAFGEIDAAFDAFQRIETWWAWPALSVYFFYPDVLGPLREDPRWNDIVRATKRGRGLELDEVEVSPAHEPATLAFQDSDRPARPDAYSETSIAVLPFEALGGAHTHPFIEGIHDDLVSGLARLSDLEVISRTSVNRYRNTSLSLPVIARELRVGWVLEGSVQQVKDDVRVRVRLVNARTDRQVWTREYSRKLTAENLFEIQAEITRKIAQSLRAQLSPEEKRRMEHAPTQNLNAYRLQVQGRRCLDQRTKEGMQKALQYFERAIVHDAEYALAWTGLASALVLLREYGHASAEGVLPRAEGAVRRALELDPFLAEAHAARALIHEARREGAQVIAALERAIELRPSYAESHNWLSWHSHLQGRPAQALESAKRAVELNPLSAEAVINLAFSHLINGDADASLQEMRRVRELDSGWPSVDFCEAMVLYHTGRFEEAGRILQDLVVPWAGSGPELTLALVHLRRGDEARVRDMLATFEEAGDHFAAGLLYAALGDFEEAFRAFQEADWTAYWPVLAIYHYYPDVLDPLRSNPRWEEVVQAARKAWGLPVDPTSSPEGPAGVVSADSLDSPGGSSQNTSRTPNPGPIQRARRTRSVSQAGSGRAEEVELVTNAIAVLPFDALGEEKTGPFIEGLHDDLIASLSRLSGLEVISRTSVIRFRETGKSLPAIARQLQVGWVLEGIIQHVGDQVRVRVRLVNARTDRQVWTQDYQRKLTAEQIFEIQSEITRKIADSLETQLTPEEERRVDRRPTDNLEAYQLYVQGRGHFHERTEEAIHQAIEFFQQAIDVDETYALAWSGLADACSLLHFYDYARPEAAWDPMEVARRALELDSELGEAHSSLGIAHSVCFEGPQAMRALHRATELKPSYAEAYVWLAWTELILGRPADALSHAQTGVGLNPLAPAYRVFLAESYLSLRRTDEALRQAIRAREIQPEYGYAIFMEGLVRYHLGQYEEAASLLARLESLELPPQGAPRRSRFRAAQAVVHAISERHDLAREVLDQIRAEGDSFAVGLVLAALGSIDEAIDAFFEVGQWDGSAVNHIRYFYPDVLYPVRKDPRYVDLMRRVDASWGLEQERELS